jgi:anti-anti-sigma regulatory factor
MASDGSASSAARSGPVVRVASEDGTTVVWLPGEHDIATAAALREELAAVTADGADVVVDLSWATLIDASIVGVLRQASQRLGAGSARPVLRDPSHLARRVSVRSSSRARLAEGVIMSGRRRGRER